MNRQFYFADQEGMKKVDALRVNLERIGAGCIVEVHDTMVSSSNIESIFSHCDIIIEAFDIAEMKEMLATEVVTRWPGKPLILGSGMAGYGGSNEIRVRDLGENLYICGDESSEVSDELPAMGPRVGIVASMQANLAIEILMKMKA
ncbi:MAG: sulfur carrier protein ThiS adenylyltransferase ThiF [Bacteroidales bacterium]